MLLERWRALRSLVETLLARLDPNDDLGAEPLEIWPILALLCAVSVSLWMFLRWRFQPMQDLGHHLAMSAVVADWGRPGSVYTSLYHRLDPVAANSLMYLFAGYLGRLVGVTHAVRGCVAFYLVGLPFATLYALRVFGRSAWGAVLSPALAYNMSFVAGFANLLFAAPFVVVTVPLFYRALVLPTYNRIVLAATLFMVVFLSHAHAFLWLGVLSAVIAGAMALRKLATGEPGTGQPWRQRARAFATVAVTSLACVLPALLLFARWYQRAFGENRAVAGAIKVTASADQGFGASYSAMDELFRGLPLNALKVLVSDEDLALLALLLVLLAAAIVLSRMHRFARPPILEMCCALTFVSYFFLPEGLSGHDVVGSRQPGVALWFLPAFLSPVPAAVSRAGRLLVVGGILILAGAWLAIWHENLVLFERDEVAGLGEVLDAAPPRLRLHYVKMSPGSMYFRWNVLWHVDKYYMADKFGHVPDTPGLLSTSAIRYRGGLKLHRITDHADDWPWLDEIWDNFDLVLVHDWEPDPEDLEEAQRRGHLVMAKGLWQLWQTDPSPP